MKILPILLLCAFGTAHAATAPFEALATINGTCQLSLTDRNFGEFTTTSSYFEHSIGVRCSRDLPYNFRFQTTNNLTVSRALKSPDTRDRIGYHLGLYEQSGASYAFVNLARGISDTYSSGIGTGELENRKIIFQVLGGYLNGASAGLPVPASYIQPGVYSDQISVSVDF